MADISSKTLSDDTPGQAANHYDQFFGPLYFEPYAIEVAKRIDPAGIAVVLEIAAGTGRVTRHIREHILPSSEINRVGHQRGNAGRGEKEIGSS